MAVVLWQILSRCCHYIKKIRPSCKETVGGRDSCIVLLYPDYERDVLWRTHVHSNKQFKPRLCIRSINWCVENQYPIELINYSLGMKSITIQQCTGKFLVALGHKLIVGLQHMGCISRFLNQANSLSNFPTRWLLNLSRDKTIHQSRWLLIPSITRLPSQSKGTMASHALFGIYAFGVILTRIPL